MKRVLLVLTALSFVALNSTAQVLFDGLQLNPSSELLFTAESTVPGLGTHHTLLYADIPGAEMRQLSVFPERVVTLGNGGQIQIQNRFGVFRTPAATTDAAADSNGAADSDGASAGDTASADSSAAIADTRPAPRFTPVGAFPAFVNGEDVQTGKTVAVGASPDGRYLSYLVPTSPGYGELRLHDIRTDQRTTVSRQVELTLDAAPLRWSSDSSFFVYSKGNQLYYFSMEQYRSGAYAQREPAADRAGHDCERSLDR